MGQLNHTERAYAKKAANQIKSNRAILQKSVEAFLIACFKKSEEEIRKIYHEHEKTWIANCMRHNARHLNVNVADKNKVITLYDDAFESAIASGHKDIKNLEVADNDLARFQYKEFVRTFDIFKRRNKLQRIIWILKKHFFVKGNYTKYKTGNVKPTLSVVK